jgi:NitT/TauT family transport system substrate-binding protein
MMKRLRIVSVAIAGALLALAASVAQADEAIETGMIGSPNGPAWPWLIADAKGYLAAAGIKLNVSRAPNASGLVQQLAAGSLELVANAGIVEPIHAVAKGAPVALLRVIGQHAPYELVAKPSIATVKDLKGQTVSIGGLIDITRVFIDRITEANGLHSSDYDRIAIGATAARFASLKSGAVAATFLSPAFNFIAEDAGFHNIALVYDYTKELPFDGSSVNATYAKSHLATLQKLVGVLDQSIAFFYDPKNRDEAESILAKAMDSQDQKSIARSYDYFQKIQYFAPTSAISRQQIAAVEKGMLAIGDTNIDVAAEKLVVPGLTKIVD